MIPRYETEKMRELFSEENKFKTWYRVELAHLDAYLIHHSKRDDGLARRLVDKLSSIDWTSFVERVSRYESLVHHDVIAFLHALEDELLEDSRLLHLGLTSSDVVDSALAITLAAASEEIQRKLTGVIRSLWEKAKAYKGVLCLGRSHGQPAEPITFGIKLLSHCNEMIRAHARMAQAIADIRVGKLSGAVGVYAHTHPDVERIALAELDLLPETVATQVVARDRHAALFSSLAVLAGSIERLATEVRLLMHGGVCEVYEPFGDGQKGSSAMPHKRNPILSENLSGLMRLIRSYAQAAMENQALWHERDISHSSVERVIARDSFSVMDFALTRLRGMITGMVVDSDRLRQNLDDVGDKLKSQSVMLALIEKGLMRQRAYEMVQDAALGMKSSDLVTDLKRAGIHRYLDDDELNALVKGGMHIRHEEVLFNRTAEAIARVMPDILAD